MRRVIGALAAMAVALALPVGIADSETPSPAPRARIAKVVTNPKPHVRIVQQFNPSATPSPGYVQAVIIPAEAARWRVSPLWLRGRIGCETGGTFRYWAHNSSGASGLAQFLPGTWSRALAVWSRPVELVSSRTRLIRRKVVLVYDNGSENRVRGRLVRQRVTLVRRGVLPRWPSVYHGWANVRAAARAMAGVGRVGAGEWSCA